MDEELKNCLWNGLASLCWEEPRQFESLGSPSNDDLKALLPILWHDYFKKPIDTFPRQSTRAIDAVRQFYFRCRWCEVYDLVEFIVDIRTQIHETA